MATSEDAQAQRIALDDIQSVIVSHAMLGEMIAELTDRQKALAGTIRDALGEATVGTVGGVDTILSPVRVNTHLDKQVIKDADPALYASAIRTTPYRPLINKTPKGVGSTED